MSWSAQYRHRSPAPRSAFTSPSCCSWAGSSFASWISRQGPTPPWRASSSCCCCSPAWWRTSSATSSRRARSASRHPTSTLLPIGGVARLERIPEEPREELLIAIAGPLVNVAIAVGAGAARPARASRPATCTHRRKHQRSRSSTGSPRSTCSSPLFNMIPAFPMDGGRVLRALLATRLGFVRATEIAASIGQGVAFALGFIGLFYNPMLIFIAIFVYLAASAEAHMVAMRAMSPRRARELGDDDAVRHAGAGGAELKRPCRRCCAPARANSRWSTEPASWSACSAAATSFVRSTNAVRTPASPMR